MVYHPTQIVPSPHITKSLGPKFCSAILPYVNICNVKFAAIWLIFSLIGVFHVILQNIFERVIQSKDLAPFHYKPESAAAQKLDFCCSYTEF